MSQSTNLNKRGFTLVELLIVIVVIGILAVISIVAYNGIIDRGKAASAKSLASQVLQKADTYNTIESTYPSYTEFIDNNGDNTPNNPDAAKLDDKTKVTQADPTNETTVHYQQCSAGTPAVGVGAIVMYWDATTKKVEQLTSGEYTGTTASGDTISCS